MDYENLYGHETKILKSYSDSDLEKRVTKCLNEGWVIKGYSTSTTSSGSLYHTVLLTRQNLKLGGASVRLEEHEMISPN